MSWILNKILPPCHLLIFSTLLGTELYQTFIMTKVSFRALPKPSFRSLQKRVFPVYFKTQTVLLFLNVVTLSGLSAATKADWLPQLVAGITAVLNLSIYEPRTRRSMIEVAHQGENYLRRHYLADHLLWMRIEARHDGATTPEMQRLRKQFSRDHAMCIHLNLVSVGAMMFYGFRLGLRLDFGSVV
ncbi:hypothetical protein QBC38DRAFT_421988 [Podospora fimiseda]|uniref:TMEM205-like domain-containing protein n=1 Tax=Podospora fimiseda TaxID=252190 RepID=A0AAN7GYL0_9PEZI|nr:hypothetical protein QBC38DRAFT_421988 [Podospora fimiseda]